MENEGRKRGRKCDFPLLGWSEKREERNGVDGRFPPRPTIFFFTSKLGIKEERIGIEKKSTKLYSLFFRPSTFIN